MNYCVRSGTLPEVGVTEHKYFPNILTQISVIYALYICNTVLLL